MPTSRLASLTTCKLSLLKMMTIMIMMTNISLSHGPLVAEYQDGTFLSLSSSFSPATSLHRHRKASHLLLVIQHHTQSLQNTSVIVLPQIPSKVPKETNHFCPPSPLFHNHQIHPTQRSSGNPRCTSLNLSISSPSQQPPWQDRSPMPPARPAAPVLSSLVTLLVVLFSVL